MARLYLMLIASSYHHRCQSHCFLMFSEYPNRLTLEIFPCSIYQKRTKQFFWSATVEKVFACHSRLVLRKVSHLIIRRRSRIKVSKWSWWYLRKCQKASSPFSWMLWESESWMGCVRAWKKFMSEKFLEALIKSVSHWGDAICDEIRIPFCTLRTNDDKVSWLAQLSVNDFEDWKEGREKCWKLTIRLVAVHSNAVDYLPHWRNIWNFTTSTHNAHLCILSHAWLDIEYLNRFLLFSVPTSVQTEKKNKRISESSDNK